MNTKRRLSDDLSNDSEILSEKRFVKLYKEELESIEKQIHDLKKLDQKDFDAKTVTILLNGTEEHSLPISRKFQSSFKEKYYCCSAEQ